MNQKKQWLVSFIPKIKNYFSAESPYRTSTSQYAAHLEEINRWSEELAKTSHDASHLVEMLKHLTDLHLDDAGSAWQEFEYLVGIWVREELLHIQNNHR